MHRGVRSAFLVILAGAMLVTGPWVSGADTKPAPTVSLGKDLEEGSWYWAEAGQPIRRSSPSKLLKKILAQRAGEPRARRSLLAAAGEDHLLSAGETSAWLASWAAGLPGFLLVPPGASRYAAIPFPEEATPGKIQGTVALLKKMGGESDSPPKVWIARADAALLGAVQETSMKETKRHLRTTTLERLDQLIAQGGTTVGFAKEDRERLRSGGHPMPGGPGERIWREVSAQATLEGRFDRTDLARRIEKSKVKISVEVSDKGRFLVENVRPGRYLLYYSTELMMILYYLELPPGGGLEVDCSIPLEFRQLRDLQSVE